MVVAVLVKRKGWGMLERIQLNALGPCSCHADNPVQNKARRSESRDNLRAISHDIEICKVRNAGGVGIIYSAVPRFNAYNADTHLDNARTHLLSVLQGHIEEKEL